MFRRVTIATACVLMLASLACGARDDGRADEQQAALSTLDCNLTVHGEYVIPQAMDGAPGYRGAHPHFTAPSHLFAQGSEVYALHFTQYDDFDDSEEEDTLVERTFTALQKGSSGAVLYDERSGGVFEPISSFDAAGKHYVVQRPKSEASPETVDPLTRQVRSAAPMALGGYPAVFARSGTTYAVDTSADVADKHVRTVDPITGRVVAEHVAPSSERALSVGHFAANGNDYVVYATRDAAVVTADAMTGQVVSRVPAAGDGEVRPVAFAKSGTTYVTVCFHEDRWTHVVTVDPIAGRKVSSIKIEDSVTAEPLVLDDAGKPRVLVRGYYKYHVISPLDGNEVTAYAKRAENDEPVAVLVRGGHTFLVDGVVEKDDDKYALALRDALTGAWQGATPPAQPRPFAGTNVTTFEQPNRTWFAFHLGDGTSRAHSVKLASCSK